jgi:hypothetical protein
MGDKTALEESWMKAPVVWQLVLFATAEVLLYLSYQHHDTRFHWFLHFFVGTSAAFGVMTLITYWSNRTILFPFLWLLVGHVIAMFPDILWSAELLPHQAWMDIFVLHISSHFIPEGIGPGMSSSCYASHCISMFVKKSLIDRNSIPS